MLIIITFANCYYIADTFSSVQEDNFDICFVMMFDFYVIGLNIITHFRLKTSPSVVQ